MNKTQTLSYDNAVMLAALQKHTSVFSTNVARILRGPRQDINEWLAAGSPISLIRDEYDDVAGRPLYVYHDVSYGGLYVWDGSRWYSSASNDNVIQVRSEHDGKEVTCVVLDAEYYGLPKHVWT